MTTALPREKDYFVPILSVLADGQSRTTRDLKSAVFARMQLGAEQIAATYPRSGESVAETCAQFALAKLRRAEAVEGGYGVARITETGRRLLEQHPVAISEAELREIPAYREHVPATRSMAEESCESKNPVPGDRVGELGAADPTGGPTAWFVGASFAHPESGVHTDFSRAFVDGGEWRISDDSKSSTKARVLEMQAGDRIAIKSVYVRRRGVPFDTHGHKVSVMDIKATGTITENPLDGVSVKVAWEQDFIDHPKHWYLYTYQHVIWLVDPDESDQKLALYDFAFNGAEQDLAMWRNDPYWADRFGDDAQVNQNQADDDDEASAAVEHEDDGEIVESLPTYTVESIVEDGCFLDEEELKRLLQTLRQKKNLILQGPPGTGKTWLAKRLGRALVETTDPELVTSVQFHPTVSYEDFVRGWCPSGDGSLKLVDGTLLEVAERAAATPDSDHVLVIEEINRGNLAQIFGEMLTLLEADKRSSDHAMRLTYRREKEKPFHLPSNLYLIGTMNLADRSLAMVDFALRRRFGFADLQPAYNDSWLQWVSERLKEDSEADVRRLRDAVVALNREISVSPGLGEQYQIGHSFFTPSKRYKIEHLASWAKTVVEQEIRPLLTEYWYDQPERVRGATEALLAALPPARS